MKGGIPDDENELLITLYALTHEQPIEHFQNAALALLKKVVPFDAAIWGTATVAPGGINIHNCHLHNKTPEMVAEYEEIKHLDSASSAMFYQPKATQGFDANSFFDGHNKRQIRAFMSKHEQPHFLLTTDLSPTTHANSSLLHWLTLYQAKQSAHFSATDVKRLHLCAPHLKQALALNRSAHLSQTAARQTHLKGLDNPLRASAIVDFKGHVYGCDGNFLGLLSKACGEDYASSSVLPVGLTTVLETGKQSFTWQRLVVHCQAEHGLIVLRVRELTIADTLTKREREIAMLVTKGRTAKQVAAELGTAPNTVRTQLQTIYSKLRVSNIAALVRAMPDGN